MKMLLPLILMTSMNLHASEIKFISCSDNQEQYNAFFKVKNDKILSYAFNDYVGWSEEIEVTPKDTVNGELWIQWGEFMDTNYGFVVTVKKDLLNGWKALNWTSGNDSDNYEAVVNDSPVACHLLKHRPYGVNIDSLNIERSL
ncbi:hypothetical protein DOM21_15475 [Bacteriovorax stolpii]|uniref:Uncharacterized protein n=1 Tax=Bacteriovorax stolpii TaxID=960 RepID=A0A2K9NNY2_BACTC|nr:hypothetical protein [Bacteriovorax stolpii]AUN97236.1 hypothetical protein C0V70_03750 [Bacteriovorax stolpii]QDK42825.1 hypothetical protein DOM21_15475 [Bacteriovorax stolpii]TDP53525.1 hypothetical protein C8D79_2170 [Bacteriovorax stolpii]